MTGENHKTKKSDVNDSKTEIDEESKSESKVKSEIKASTLEKELKNLKKENEELITLLKTVQADFQNYKKRVDKLKDEDKLRANESIIKDLLDVLDAVEIGVKHSKDDGLSLIYNKLLSLLENYGCKKIAKLDRFDPSLHQAIAFEHTEDKNKDGMIIEVFQSGFKLGNKVIRHAKVKVLKKD